MGGGASASGGSMRMPIFLCRVSEFHEDHVSKMTTTNSNACCAQPQACACVAGVGGSFGVPHAGQRHRTGRNSKSVGSRDALIRLFSFRCSDQARGPRLVPVLRGRAKYRHGCLQSGPAFLLPSLPQRDKKILKNAKREQAPILWIKAAPRVDAKIFPSTRPIRTPLLPSSVGS